MKANTGKELASLLEQIGLLTEVSALVFIVFAQFILQICVSACTVWILCFSFWRKALWRLTQKSAKLQISISPFSMHFRFVKYVRQVFARSGAAVQRCDDQA